MKYENDPSRKDLATMRAEIDFDVLASLNKNSSNNTSSSSLARNTALSPPTDNSLSEKLKSALNGLTRPVEPIPAVSIKIAKEEEKEEISEVEKNLKLTLDLLNSVNNLENLTPAQAADVLKVFQGKRFFFLYKVLIQWFFWVQFVKLKKVKNRELP